MLNGELKKKVIFVTGKGGVGKSTITSAIACHLAEEGRKVLVIDADPAHSMPDVFGITDKVYGKNNGFVARTSLVRVFQDLQLDLLVLNPVNVREKYVGSYRILWLAELGKDIGFFSHLDRMSEFFSLADTLYKMYRSYDYFVIDNEPSAGTLDMIENIDGWLKALDNVSKHSVIFQTMIRLVLDRQLATEVGKLLFDNNGQFIDDFKTMLRSIKALFMDSERFQPIIVSSPEDAVIRETYRLRKELADRLGVVADSIVFNKVSQDAATIEQQKSRMKKLQDICSAHCYTVPLKNPEEVNLQTEDGARSFIGYVQTSLLAL